VALFVVLELFSNNNIVEAWLYGKKTGMSAVAVLLAAVFWRWLWGVAGLLLATPLFASVRTTERMSRRRWRRHKNRSAC
jgi:predicted PurR-regulated permease PerM